MKRWMRTVSGVLAAALMITGCGSGKNSGEIKLNPDKPVSIDIWHYYNGPQQVAFDKLVDEFNETVGKEQGIYVEGHSQGDVTQLEDNVLAALNEEVGSDEAPNIFSSYADTAYAIEKMGYLADISQYLTEEELNTYIDSYIDEGRIGADGELKIFPTAKSSEIFMMNKTDWDKFAEATGAKLEQLDTIEGVADVAKAYYEWTDAKTPDVQNDGKAFFGRDAMANLFIIGSMQLGCEIFSVDKQKVTLNIDRDVMKHIWDYYYVPYIKGYFSAYGRFRSDDVKIGEVIAFVGSTTSSMYFPDEVELENKTYPIDYIVRKAPAFEGGEAYSVQQGAGMVVTKTTPEEEYASVVFLKWFTQEENNLAFGCTSGYLPVKKSANQKDALDKVIKEENLEVAPKTYDTLVTAFDTVNTNKMYTNKAFDGGSAARKVLEYNLSDKAAQDREAVEKLLKQGESLESATAEFLSDEAFNEWFEQLKAALEQSL